MRIIYSRLLDYLTKLDILCDNQFGFRKNHSTTLALIDMHDKISSALSVGFQSKINPKNGIFEVLAARKMGREQKMREGEGKRKQGRKRLFLNPVGSTASRSTPVKSCLTEDFCSCRNSRLNPRSPRKVRALLIAEPAR